MALATYITCPVCSKRHIRSTGFERSTDTCSMDCYRKLPMPIAAPHITVSDVLRLARQYTNQKACAEAMGVSYANFRRMVAKMKIRYAFPEMGGWGRGYE